MNISFTFLVKIFFGKKLSRFLLTSKLDPLIDFDIYKNIIGAFVCIYL